MTKDIKKKIIKIFIILLFFSTLYLIKRYFNYLPPRFFTDLQSKSFSPNKKYTLEIYLYSGGATQDWTSIVKMINNYTGKSRNIYQVYHEKKVEIYWINENIVEINGKKINLLFDTYIKY